MAYLISIGAGLGILLVGGSLVEFCEFATYGVAAVVAVVVTGVSTGILSASRGESPITAFGHALFTAALIAGAAFVGLWEIFGAQSCGE